MTMQEDYALARDAAMLCDAQHPETPLYLNRFNIERFQVSGISPKELERAIQTQARHLKITADVIEQLIQDYDVIEHQ